MIRFPKRLIEALLSELDRCCKTAKKREDLPFLDVHMLEEELARSDTETQRLYRVMASGFDWREIEQSESATANEFFSESKAADEST